MGTGIVLWEKVHGTMAKGDVALRVRVWYYG